MFAPWKSKVPETVNFLPVLYPGRELRKSEPMPETVTELVDQFVTDNEALFDRDFILFGHCTGTLLAYQVLLEVRRRFGKEPLCLIASGSEAPHYWMEREREMGQADLTANQVIERMVDFELIDQETAGSVMFCKYYLPIYQMDLKMLGSYQYTPHEKLDCPVQVLYGREDLTLREIPLRCWQTCTNDIAAFQVFEGKHFYFAADKKPILAYLKELIAHILKKDEQEGVI